MTTHESSFELYEAAIRSQPATVDERWFCAQLAAWRTGNEAASRRIAESHLALVLDIAKVICLSLGAENQLLEAVQEANAALIEALGQFHGDTAEEFSRCAAAAARHRVHRYVTAVLLGFRESVATSAAP